MKAVLSVMMTLVAVHVLTVPVAGDPTTGDCEEIIARAPKAYYNQRRLGFGGFRATIKPNWKVILGNTATRQNLKVFQSIRFSMTVDANGIVTVTHDFSEQGGGKADAYIKPIHDDMQRLVSGFFGIWRLFMITPPFPESSTPLKTENSPAECHFLFTTEATEVVLAMTNDLLITELRLTGARSRRTIRPVFEKTSEGLLLKGYYSLFEPLGEGTRTEIESTVEYQNVNGMKLPSKVKLRGTLGSEPIAAELEFNQHVLNPRVMTSNSRGR